MTIIIETVIATLASVVIAFLGYQVFSLKRSNRELALSVLQESIDKTAISQKLEETVAMINSTNVEDKDGFIKFLSQSREWAFDYIENVQSTIKVLDQAMRNADEAKINDAYKELMKFLPDEGMLDK